MRDTIQPDKRITVRPGGLYYKIARWADHMASLLTIRESIEARIAHCESTLKGMQPQCTNAAILRNMERALTPASDPKDDAVIDLYELTILALKQQSKGTQQC